ncbi:MAG: site-specific integrase, partial [Chloroflexota bacterium]
VLSAEHWGTGSSTGSPPSCPASQEQLHRPLHPRLRGEAARNHSPFLVVLGTGLRLSELAGLLVEDVQSETGVIKIRQRKGGKGGMVRVGVQTRKVLMRYLARRPGESPYLWLSEEDVPITACRVEQVLARLCRRVGVKFNGVHAFRQNWCVASLRNGADLKMVKLLGGWSTLAVPDHYSQSL